MRISVIREYNLDHIEDQIVCLNDFDNKDLIDLKKVLLNVCYGKIVVLSEQYFIKTSDCRLILNLSYRSEGLREVFRNVYVCFLSRKEYQEIITTIDLFINNDYEENTYQWLYDINNPIDFLLSKNCKW